MNFGKALAYPFKDIEWFRKIIIGGSLKLSMITGVLFFLNFFALGYLVEVMRQLPGKEDPTMPEWDRFSAKFANGLLMTVIFLAYTLLFGGLGALWIVFVATSDLFITSTMVIGIILGSLFILFGISIFGLLGTLVFAQQNDFAAAFRIPFIWNLFLKDSFSFIIIILFAIFLTIVMAIIGMGIFTPFTLFWAQVVVARILAEYGAKHLPETQTQIGGE